MLLPKWVSVIDRPFLVPSHWKCDIGHVKRVRFATGTPLGALSVWPVFTLAHHLLVQLSAFNAGLPRRWLSNVAILGDDLVIGHPDVAREYEKLVGLMQVSISSVKSLISHNGSLAFAARLIWRGADVSPISHRLVANARWSASCVPSLLSRIREFRDFRISELFRLRGAGYRILALLGSSPRTLPKRWFRLFLLFYAKGSPFSIPFEWWLALGRDYPIPVGVLGVLHQRLMENFMRKWPGQLMAGLRLRSLSLVVQLAMKS